MSSLVDEFAASAGELVAGLVVRPDVLRELEADAFSEAAWRALAE